MKTTATTHLFNAHHSPIGAFASFTLGHQGAKGGFGIARTGPANDNVYIGVEDAETPGQFHALPFFSSEQSDEASDYDVEGIQDTQYQQAIRPYKPNEVSRKLDACTDEWATADFSFRIYTPILPVPDPATADAESLRAALVPAVIAELTLDNTTGEHDRKVFFGFSAQDPGPSLRLLDDNGIVGLGQGRSILIATDDQTAYAGIGFQPEAALFPRHPDNLNCILGSNGLLVATVPAGEKKTIRYSINFYAEGGVTTGVRTSYYYTSLFDSIESVAAYALGRADKTVVLCQAADANLSQQLSHDRYTMMSHAIRSYYGATQFLITEAGEPLWVVNEGEYRMINTFDLTVDQLFMELALNPWTVKNVLDLFVSRYSYTDQVRFPDSEELHPGGLVFTHDMGVGNVFSNPGFSCYEQSGLKGCFSYMSCEELVNWILCATLYVNHTGDLGWAKKNAVTFDAVLQSMINRDHPVAAERNGVMGLDSSRCDGGAEITTYDSLDASLGQARNNIYLGVKSWAGYLMLERLFNDLGNAEAAQSARTQADLAAATIGSAADESGCLPAILNEGVAARIIPAIEGLVFPHLGGLMETVSSNPVHAKLVETLTTHFEAIMKPGVCLFPDGGWKLSSTSRNSWLSKIYLCQFVAEAVLGTPADAAADKAHLDWLMDVENAYFAWSDQMVEGRALGSRYYPRGVTSTLWLARDLYGVGKALSPV